MSLTDRVPPQNIEAEQSVLGAAMLDNNVIADIEEVITAGDFYRDAHRIIYEAITELHHAGKPADLIALNERLKDDLNKIGGITYIATLTNFVPTSANAVYYAKIVRDKAIQRRLIQTAAQITEQAYNGEYEDINELIASAQSEICGIEANNKQGLTHIKELIPGSIEAIEKRMQKKTGITGIPTGHARLDLWTAGWQPGNLIIIAARPSMGKTSYAVQEGAEAAIKCGKKVGIFSLEMSKNQLVEKLFANIGMVDGQRIRIGRLEDEDWQKITVAASKLYDSGLYIDDEPRATILDIRAKCRRMKQQSGLDMVIVDYLQLMKPAKKYNSLVQEVDDNTKELKAISKELDVPMIVLSQLSRECEKRSDKKPILSDLRDSGGIEQNADLVAFLYRDDYYNANSQKPGVTELIIAKQREGPTGTLELYFQKQFTRFAELTRA